MIAKNNNSSKIEKKENIIFIFIFYYFYFSIHILILKNYLYFILNLYTLNLSYIIYLEYFLGTNISLFQFTNIYKELL